MPYWITFADDKGSPNLRGPYYSRIRAEEKRDRMDVESDLHQLSTSDKGEATRRLKEERVDSLGVSEGVRRFSHKGEEE